MHDFVNNSLFDLDFKIENQNGTYASKKKKNVVQAHKKLSNMKEPLNYGSIRIGFFKFYY